MLTQLKRLHILKLYCNFVIDKNRRLQTMLNTKLNILLLKLNEKTRSSLKSFPLKEKVAKLLLPRGSYGDGWYDHWGDCGGGGGGDYYDSTEANILSHGQTAVNVITNSIQDNTAIWCKYVQETKGFQLLSATSFASGVPNFQYDLITALKADEGIVRTLGTAMEKGNTILSSGIALIGLADGDTADLLSALSAGIGILGITTSVAPPVALTLDGISFVLSIASTYLSQQQNGNPSSY